MTLVVAEEHIVDGQISRRIVEDVFKAHKQHQIDRLSNLKVITFSSRPLPSPPPRGRAAVAAAPVRALDAVLIWRSAGPVSAWSRPLPPSAPVATTVRAADTFGDGITSSAEAERAWLRGLCARSLFVTWRTSLIASSPLTANFGWSVCYPAPSAPRSRPPLPPLAPFHGLVGSVG